MVILGKTNFKKRQNQITDTLDTLSGHLFARGFMDHSRKLRAVSKDILNDTYNLKNKDLDNIEAAVASLDSKITSGNYSASIVDINNISRFAMKKGLEDKTQTEIVNEEIEVYKADLVLKAKEVENKKLDLQRAIDSHNFADWKLAKVELAALEKEQSDLEVSYNTLVNTASSLKVAESGKARHTTMSDANKTLNSIDVVENQLNAKEDLEVSQASENIFNELLGAGSDFAANREKEQNEFDRLCELNELSKSQKETENTAQTDNDKIGVK